VKAVLRNYRAYRDLYGPQAASPPLLY